MSLITIEKKESLKTITYKTVYSKTYVRCFWFCWLLGLISFIGMALTQQMLFVYFWLMAAVGIIILVIFVQLKSFSILFIYLDALVSKRVIKQTIQKANWEWRSELIIKKK